MSSPPASTASPSTTVESTPYTRGVTVRDAGGGTSLVGATHGTTVSVHSASGGHGPNASMMVPNVSPYTGNTESVNIPTGGLTITHGSGRGTLPDLYPGNVHFTKTTEPILRGAPSMTKLLESPIVRKDTYGIARSVCSPALLIQSSQPVAQHIDTDVMSKIAANHIGAKEVGEPRQAITSKSSQLDLSGARSNLEKPTGIFEMHDLKKNILGQPDLGNASSSVLSLHSAQAVSRDCSNVKEGLAVHAKHAVLDKSTSDTLPRERRLAQEEACEPQKHLNLHGEIQLCFMVCHSESDACHVTKYSMNIEEGKWILLEKSGNLKQHGEFCEDFVTFSSDLETRTVTVNNRKTLSSEECFPWIKECTRIVNDSLLQIETTLFSGPCVSLIEKLLDTRADNGNLHWTKGLGTDGDMIQLFTIDDQEVQWVQKNICCLLQGNHGDRMIVKIPVEPEKLKMLDSLNFPNYCQSVLFSLRIYLDEGVMLIESSVPTDYREHVKQESLKFEERLIKTTFDEAGTRKCLMFDARDYLVQKLKRIKLYCWWKEDNEGRVILLALTEKDSRSVQANLAEFLRTHIVQVKSPKNGSKEETTTFEVENLSQSAERKQPVAVEEVQPETRMISVHPLEFKLIQKDPVKVQLKAKLYDKDVGLDLEAKSAELIVTRGDLQKVISVMKQFFHHEALNAKKDDVDVQKAIHSLEEKKHLKDAFAHRYDSGQWEFCFLSSCKEEICAEVQKLKTLQENVPVPLYVIDFFGLKLDQLNKIVKEKTHQSVNIRAVQDGQGYQENFQVEVSAERGVIQDATMWVKRFVQKMKFKIHAQDIGVARALFLQGPAGHELICQVEKEEKCRIDVQLRGQQVVFRATHTNGKQMIVCQGNIAFSDCDVMVLPLHDEQKEWPPQSKLLLQKGLLAEDVQLYKNLCKDEPTSLQCNGELSGKTLIVVQVPSKWKGDNNEKQRVTTAYQDVLSSCKEGQQTIAVLAKQIPGVPLHKPLKPVIHDVTNFLSKQTSSPCNTFVIVTDRKGESQEVCKILQDGLPDGWVARPHTVPRPCATKMKAMKVVIGEIQNTKADAVVNSTSTTLVPSEGAVEKAIRKAAGEKMIRACQKLYPKGINKNGLAVTESFNMTTAKKIFHIALSMETLSEKNEAALLDDLGRVVHQCLLEATWQGCCSIAFPTLGSGVLKYPCDAVARIMFFTVNNFFREMPHSSLHTVLVVVHHKNLHAIQTFKMEEMTQLYGSSQDESIPEERFEMRIPEKSHLIQIIHGNVFQREWVSEVCVHGNLASGRGVTGPSENADSPCQSVIVKPELNTRENLKQLVKQALSLGVSVQIAVQTLSSQSQTDVAVEVEDALQKIDKPKLVSFIINDKEKAEGYHRLLQHVTGGHIPFSGINAGSAAGGQISVCSLVTNTVGTIMPKIKGIVIPEKYRMMAKLFKAFREGQTQIASLDEQDGQINDSCVLTVPNKHLQNTSLQKILFGLPVQTHKSQYRTKFEVKFEELQKTVTALCTGTDSALPQEQSEERAEVISSKTKEVKSEKDTTLSKDMSELEVAALRYLLKEDFEEAFNVKPDGNAYLVSPRGAISGDLIGKLDALRREDVPLSESEVAKLEDTVDVRKEGIEAFIKNIPSDRKAAVFAFDYNAISKAKHLLTVKAGRVKVTARSRRRFDPASSGQEDRGDQSPPQSLQSPSGGGNAEFVTPSGIKVSVYKTDITKLPVDAIVNAANEHLAHGGGVAYAIASAAGYQLEEDGREYLLKNGPLKVSGVAVTGPGNLPCTKVLHAVGPRWSDYTDKGLCQQLLIDTVYNCLLEADSLGLRSLALPAISSAIFGVPQQICAQSYLSAIQKFEDQKGDRTNIKHIHFVDISEGMVTCIQGNFADGWHNKSENKVTTQRFQPTMERLEGSTESGTSCTGDVTEHSSLDTPKSGFDESKPYSSTSQKRSLSPFPQDNRLAESSIETEAIPILTVHGQKTETQYHFEFPGLNLALIFLREHVSKVKTEAIVLWQDVQNVLKDDNSKDIQKKLSAQDRTSVKNLKTRLTSPNTVQSVKTTAGVLLLPVISLDDMQERDKVLDVVEKALNNLENVASVAIPRIAGGRKCTKQSSKPTDCFAAVVYLAVKNYSKGAKRSLKQIYIVDKNQEELKDMVDIVSEMMAKEKSMLEQNVQAVSRMPQKSSKEEGNNSSETCVICFETLISRKTLTCGHSFCPGCIDKWMKMNRPSCPCCNKAHGTAIGNQPPGSMGMFYDHRCLEGYDGPGTYVIDYFIGQGYQTEEHPNPGKFFKSTQRRAYLPDTKDGRSVLMLLKTAFDRRLIFTIGHSVTNNETGVIWNDIHHKTKPSGGPPQYGYPDTGYLRRVREELATKGVTERALSTKQRDFIENPEIYRKSIDFSDRFNEGTEV